MSIFENMLPTAAGSIFSENSWNKVVGKWKMEPEDLRWQVWWVYVGAWWGPKPKMLIFHWFYSCFLKCQEGPEDANRANRQASRAASMSKKWYFLLKMLCVYIWKYASHCSGKHISRNCMKKSGRKVKNGAGRLWMASVMGTCGGFVGPKKSNVEKPLV